MAIVQSFGQLQALADVPRPIPEHVGESLSLYGLSQAYAEIYRTQPNVRICVDFLARNIAQLGLHVFRRVSDTDRQRLNDHELARWFAHPNPAKSRYRLFEDLIADLGVYFNALWLKVRYLDAQGRRALGFVRLPPDQLEIAGTVMPTQVWWTPIGGRRRSFDLADVVLFNGYNPGCASIGLSPLETLRNILAEEDAAARQRRDFWQNGARIDGVVERPATAPKWTSQQKQDWREQWQKFSVGGAKAGMTAVLEDGMTYKPQAFSARDSEYTVSGKLRREVVAAAYHIPLPMVGILEHATFSNIKEQHKQLYQDSLGPWLEMITQELERQVLIECEDQRDVYVEFNIADKLKGSFEEQAASLRALVGRPIMTANEGRARLNLPRHEDPSADELAAQQGGPAAVDSGTPPAADDTTAMVRAIGVESETAASASLIVAATRERQRVRLAKLASADRAAAFFVDIDRWNRELGDDLEPIVGRTAADRLAHTVNIATLQQLEALS